MSFRKKDLFEKNDSIIKIVLVYFVLLCFVVVSVYPILNVLSIALRPSNNLFSLSLKIIPDDATFANFTSVWKDTELPKWLLSSLIISSSATLIGVLLSITGGYAFSRFNFIGKKPGMVFLLISQMFPATMMLLPLYLMLMKLGFDNKISGLVIVYVATSIPFNIWILKGYFDTIPKSLEESAFVDGASTIKAFYSIVLPLIKPAIALAALNSFMGSWSEYALARVIITDTDKFTLPLGLTNLQGAYQTSWGVYSAGALITALPIIILFVSLSKFLVGGLTLGSVKG